MELRGYLFFVYFLIVLAISCKNDTVGMDDLRTSSNPDIIATSKEHLAFPDLIWHKEYWYVTFRQSDAHVDGTYSKIIIMKSPNFIDWEECNSFEYLGFDLRDPRFSCNQLNDSLYLHFHAVSEGNQYALVRKNLYISLSNLSTISGTLLDSNYFKELQLPSDNQFDWLWRPIWQNGKLLVGGYYHNSVRIYEYDEIQNTPKILANFDIGIGETTIREYTNGVYCISRKKGAGTLGFGSLQLQDFRWKDLLNTEIGGPNFVIRNDTIFLGGRLNSTTSIFSYSLKNSTLHLVYEFPSKYPDCGYPGLFLKDDKIYGVYYTVSLQNEGFQIKTFTL